MTVLYIGGAAQGKRALAMATHSLIESQVAQGGALQSADELRTAKMLDQLHLLTRRMLERGEQPSQLLPWLQDKVVVCDEIGCGIVPLDPFERQWREETGRLCCEIAKVAGTVIRVHCGLPQFIKGTLP